MSEPRGTRRRRAVTWRLESLAVEYGAVHDVSTAAKAAPCHVSQTVAAGAGVLDEEARVEDDRVPFLRSRRRGDDARAPVENIDAVNAKVAFAVRRFPPECVKGGRIRTWGGFAPRA